MEHDPVAIARRALAVLDLTELGDHATDAVTAIAAALERSAWFRGLPDALRAALRAAGRVRRCAQRCSAPPPGW